MKPWEPEELRRAMKGKWITRGGRPITGKISTDSRRIEGGAAGGEIFFALVGENHDAHKFLGDVIEKGAALLVVHKEPSLEIAAAAREKGVAILKVDDTIAALNRLAGAYRADLRAKVIAIGGSNGKTTTKRILHAILVEKFGASAGVCSPKSFNNNIGMPLTLLEASPSNEFVILEIGTNAPGEITALGSVCNPDIAVITSIGLEHLEKLFDLAGVAKEEASIAPHIKPAGTLVTPGDIPELAAALKAAKVKISQRIYVGIDSNGGADPKDVIRLNATDVAETITGVSFSIAGRGRFELPLLGRHNVQNALLAMAVAIRLGVGDKELRSGLLKVVPADGRLQLMEIAGHRVINDAYNANPSSMKEAILLFTRLQKSAAKSSRKKSRSVAILGDMLELGAASETMHRDIGQTAAGAGIDLLVTVGKEMKAAADAAKGIRVVRFPSSAAAKKGINEHLKPGDAILLKGSNSMKMGQILEALGEVPALAH